MLTFDDEKLINKCLDKFLKENKSIDVASLKLKMWEFAKLMANNAEITEDIVNKMNGH